MKKNRLASILLSAALLTGAALSCPAAAAPAASPAPSPAVSAAPAPSAAPESTVPQTAQLQSALLSAMHIQANAAVLVDHDTGEVLYAQERPRQGLSRLHHQGHDLSAHAGIRRPGGACPG